MNQLEEKELISLDEYSEGIEVTIPFSSEELEILTSWDWNDVPNAQWLAIWS